MKSNAPGQLLGFSIQFPRALLHLLKGGSGSIVCVEVLGDVATKKADGIIITEEDKSSIVGNPLTDKSTDLWKTFSNWIEAVNDKSLSLEKTYFLIYTNQSGRKGIINLFNDARDVAGAKSAIKSTRTKLKDVKKDHEIWTYFDYVMNQNENILMEIIQKFELQIGDGAGYKDVRTELVNMLVPASQIEFMLDSLNGWLTKEINEKIVKRLDATIKWEDFQKQFLVLFDRARKRELIDFTSQYPPKDSEIKKQVKLRPVYLKELDAIETSDDEILEAVSDFIRAKVNRGKWIENEIIDEDVAADFESKLNKYWANQRKRIELTEKRLSENERGQLLYGDCKIRQETIRDMSPPSSTIAGTFHSLVNEKTLGWHPNWGKKPINNKK